MGNQTKDEIVSSMIELDRRGLNHGVAGNISVRSKSGAYVTPSGIPPMNLTSDKVVEITLDGEYSGEVKPTSEWQMHTAILKARPDINAIVHCHSEYATILACAHRSIPPIHYMTAVTGGAEIKVAPYATFGSVSLAQNIVTTLEHRLGCLMANHGQIAVAPSLELAMLIATEIEQQAKFYCGTLAIGGPKLMSEVDIQEVKKQFSKYGQRR